MPTNSEEDAGVPNGENLEEKDKSVVNPDEKKDAVIDYEKKMNDMFEKFNNKIDEITGNYDKKIKELNDTIVEKDKEIQKQKDITAKIVMNTSTGKNDGEVDFKHTDFDDIDWNKQASKFIGKIDAKILG